MRVIVVSDAGPKEIRRPELEGRLFLKDGMRSCAGGGWARSAPGKRIQSGWFQREGPERTLDSARDVRFRPGEAGERLCREGPDPKRAWRGRADRTSFGSALRDALGLNPGAAGCPLCPLLQKVGQERAPTSPRNYGANPPKGASAGNVRT